MSTSENPNPNNNNNNNNGGGGGVLPEFQFAVTEPLASRVPISRTRPIVSTTLLSSKSAVRSSVASKNELTSSSASLESCLSVSSITSKKSSLDSVKQKKDQGLRIASHSSVNRPTSRAGSTIVGQPKVSSLSSSSTYKSEIGYFVGVRSSVAQTPTFTGPISVLAKHGSSSPNESTASRIIKSANRYTTLSMLRISMLLLSCLLSLVSTQGPGFVSLDCGGDKPFTDELGLKWSPDHLTYGQAATISTPTKAQYMILRHFPTDSRKYCYSLNVTSSNRYLVRASFLYGNFDSKNVYPSFSIYIGSTHWATIVISEASKVERAELVFLASTSSVSVCLSNATSGQPFISTLELRQLGRSMYYTAFEKRFYMTVVARINFGAESEDSVRYPDDLIDRIWESDLLAKAKYLVDDSVGTVRVSTTLPIESGNSARENPPQKVMQTAVVGTNGSLAYRINLDGFPSSCWAYMYFAKIEDLANDELRKFRLVIADQPEDGRPMVNMKKTVQRPYRVFEFGYPNITLPLVFKFGFVKTIDSSKGPILNAMEIIKHLSISDGPVDVTKKKGGDDNLTKPKGGDKTSVIIGVLVCVTILLLAAICWCIYLICKCKETSEPAAESDTSFSHVAEVAGSSSYLEEVASSSSYVEGVATSSSSYV